MRRLLLALLFSVAFAFSGCVGGPEETEEQSGSIISGDEDWSGWGGGREDPYIPLDPEPPPVQCKSDGGATVKHCAPLPDGEPCESSAAPTGSPCAYSFECASGCCDDLTNNCT